MVMTAVSTATKAAEAAITPFSEEDKLVAGLSEILALKLDFDPATAYLIGKAAELHDIGKSIIPSHILNKPDILTPEEFRIVKTHTFWGANMLRHLQGGLDLADSKDGAYSLHGAVGSIGDKGFWAMARDICLWHHERYDGHGYWGKSLDKLPSYIPIVSICDVYIAVTSDIRPYKKPWSHEQALAYIESESDKQFCPKLTKSFLHMMSDNAILRRIAA